MPTAFWALKGGSGTTVTAVAAALAAAHSQPVLLADLAGDAAAVLGLSEDGPGVGDWLDAGADVPADALDRLLVSVDDNLALLPAGAPGRRHPAADGGPARADRGPVLAQLLARNPRRVIVDAGTRPSGIAAHVVRAADESVLVARPCYLTLRAMPTMDLPITAVVVVREPQRCLGGREIELAVGAPVRATVPVDPAVARAVDAGVLAARLPRSLRRAVRPLVTS